MNFSPLNDAEFQEYREEVHRKQAKKRRVRTLIILASVALVSAALIALLGFAAYEAWNKGLINVPKPFSNNTPAPLPPTDGGQSDSVVPFSPGETEGSSSTGTESPSDASPYVPTPSVTPPDEPTGVTHKTTIYIDPGHGFRSGVTGRAMDLGAGSESAYTRISTEQGKALYEADLNLIISQKLRDRLVAAGYEVIMSREDYVEQPLSLAERAYRVNNATPKPDACISVHANFYSGAGTAYGARVYACDTNKRSDGAACQSFARTVMAAIDAADASRRSASLQDGNGLVMCNSTRVCPAILVETCFLTDETDARNALTEEWQDKMALALFNGVTTQFPLEYSFE